MRTLKKNPVLATLLIAFSAPAFAADSAVSRPQLSDAEAFGQSRIRAADVSDRDINHPYSQLVTVQIGPYTPRSIAFTNWNNNSFNYSDQSRGSFLAELGWAVQLFPLGPTSIFISESIAYSNMTLKLPANLLPQVGDGSVTLHMFGFDTRIMQAYENFPLKNIVPFWEGGIQYTLYNQTGTSDLVAGEGGVSNFVAAVGMRYWVNRESSINKEFPGRYNALPIFLTAKVNKIFENNSGFDPGNTSFLAGLSVGL